MTSDYVSQQLRSQASELRRLIAGPTPYTTAASRPDTTAERAARRTEAKQRQADALAGWERVRELATDHTDSGVLLSISAVLLAVLDVHKPTLGQYDWQPVCDHCFEGGYDVESCEWPCVTYEVMREGLEL